MKISRSSWRREKIKLYFRTIGPEVAAISFCSLIVGLVEIIWRFFRADHRLPFLSEEDIVSLTRIDCHYQISLWWELLFFWIWGMLLYWVGNSHFLKSKWGIMQNVFLILVISTGIFCAVSFKGMLYGLLASTFISLVVVSFELISILWGKIKPILLSSPDD